MSYASGARVVSERLSEYEQGVEYYAGECPQCGGATWQDAHGSVRCADCQYHEDSGTPVTAEEQAEAIASLERSSLDALLSTDGGDER